jgi:uncharacterized protein
MSGASAGWMQDLAVRQPFVIGGLSVKAGERQLVDLPISKLSNHAPVTLPVHVLHGSRAGPTMFVAAAIHGDELNGVEIIRRLLRTLDPRSIRGTLLGVPVVNVFGFISRSRYLPDRRDLNRSFPGSANGSLAARLAHLFLTEIVKQSQVGIDLHTAAIHRINLPQIRCAFGGSPRCLELGTAFGTEVMLESQERPGSLRQAARAEGVDVLSYEGGEGLRFDEFAIRAGVDGVTGVMLAMDMLDAADVELPSADRRTPVLINASSWVRAPEGGVFRTAKRIGDTVDIDEVVGHLANPYEDIAVEVHASRRGIIIGRTTLPIVNMGDALLNVGWSEEFAQGSISPERTAFDAPPFDEDELLD